MKRKKNDKIRIEFKLEADQPGVYSMIMAALIIGMIIVLVKMLLSFL